MQRSSFSGDACAAIAATRSVMSGWFAWIEPAPPGIADTSRASRKYVARSIQRAVQRVARCSRMADFCRRSRSLIAPVAPRSVPAVPLPVPPAPTPFATPRLAVVAVLVNARASASAVATSSSAAAVGPRRRSPRRRGQAKGALASLPRLLVDRQPPRPTA